MSTINNLLGEDQRRDKLRFPIEKYVQYQLHEAGQALGRWCGQDPTN
jgi:hypothetical protein